LSSEHRAVVELCYFEGRSCAEIAAIMQCPVNTVKTRMFHARRRLRAVMAGGTAAPTRDVRVLRMAVASGSNT